MTLYCEECKYYYYDPLSDEHLCERIVSCPNYDTIKLEEKFVKRPKNIILNEKRICHSERTDPHLCGELGLHYEPSLKTQIKYFFIER